MIGSAFFGGTDPQGLVLGKRGKSRFSPAHRLPHDQRSAHIYVVGLSGKGKSKFLEHLIFQDISNGRGCGLIDPHSLLIDDLMKYMITAGILLDPEIQEKVIYIDPSRTDYVVPFNVLATEGTPYDIASGILEAFRRTWPESLREAPHFANVATAALIVLVENKLTLMDMHRLLTDSDFREQCLEKVSEQSAVEYFRQRYDRWGRDAPVMKESTLNKVGAFSLNPRLKMMLGQKENHLDFVKIMDEGKILLLDLGRSDGETNRLIGNLVTTGIERAMRRRTNRRLWPLTIDEFASYVANEGSVKTLSHVFSEGRKFALSMCVGHQDLSQLTPRMLGALSNVQTKVIFGVGRQDAEHFAKSIGRVDIEAVKRDPKTQTQHEIFEPVSNQWEEWVDHIRFQPARQALVAGQDGTVAKIRTISIPPYKATEAQVEEARTESLRRYGILYSDAARHLKQIPENNGQEGSKRRPGSNFGW